MSDLETFRKETRAWLEANCPPGNAHAPRLGEDDTCWGGRRVEIQVRSATPMDGAHGGQGLDGARMAARIRRRRALARRGENPAPGNGRARMPLAARQLRHLDARPRAARNTATRRRRRSICRKSRAAKSAGARAIPNPAPAPTSPRCRPAPSCKGDHFIVNGSKIWTSYADKADWIFCLVRTEPNAPKHEGISFVLFDMESAGVSTKPITLISGASPFCQTFFDDVTVPRENLVGTMNKGWDIAKYLLTHERDMIGGMGRTSESRSLGQIAAESVGIENGVLADTVLRGQIAYLRNRRARVQAYDGARGRHGEDRPGASGDFLAAEILRHRAQQASDGARDVGRRLRCAGMGRRALARRLHARAWLRSKANSIEGGTSEVQLNIIAKRILGFPGA